MQGKGVYVSYSSIKKSLWLVDRWSWKREQCFVSSCFSFVSLGSVFLESPAIVYGLLLGYDTRLGVGAGGGGKWRVASVVKWNKSHYLSGVCCCCSLNVS